MPSARIPQMPPTAWTETEPPGSSTSRRSSSHSIANVITVPEIDPITTASAGLTKAQDALLATSPPTQPLAVSEASGLPKRTLVMNAAVSAEADAASMVLMPINAAPEASLPVKRIAPAELSPIQPTRASMQPNRTRTELWPGIAGDIPSSEYFPRRGPNIHVPARVVSPPRPSIAPSAAPHPMRKQRISPCVKQSRRKATGSKTPAVRAAPQRDQSCEADAKNLKQCGERRSGAVHRK